MSIAPCFWPSKPLAGLGRIWNHYLLTMLTWNRRDSTPLSAESQAPKGDQGWIFFFFWSDKSLSGLPESGPYRIFVLVFNWNHFEMRLLNLRINFYLLQTFFLILVVFELFLLSLRSGQISPLAFFRWFTATLDRNDESCNRIPSNYCESIVVVYQLWKAVITGDTVTRLSIPIWGRGKSPEEGQRWNLAGT